jgi:beta-1,4-N-acetylglucosaminyltransferase
MCELVKATFSGQSNVHRRYVVTSGDSSSVSAMQKLENKIQAAFPSDLRTGTFDCLPIPRARHVHQPFYTAPFTTIQSAMHIVRVLTRRPESRPHSMFGDDFRYPHVIVTNGPGTGFVVCVVAYMLKLFMITPQDRLKVVYVESWARSQSLSLTGKLFHLTGLADLFLVQQQSLARKFDKQYIGVFSGCAPTRT